MGRLVFRVGLGRQVVLILDISQQAASLRVLPYGKAITSVGKQGFAGNTALNQVDRNWHKVGSLYFAPN